MIRIENLSKSFGDKKVLDSFSELINDGEHVGISGESGNGKTTLLRIIAGLDKDYKGEIIGLNDKISYVFQEPRLLPALNVIENIKLVERGSELNAHEILSILELENDKLLYPGELSGGMKMRVSLARALYHNGDVFIMDEPFSALDDDLKNRILPKIFNLLNNKTVIIVTHNQEEAEKYGDNIIKI
jgi:NitT/TauT family transport system ATP-binding protein